MRNGRAGIFMQLEKNFKERPLMGMTFYARNDILSATFGVTCRQARLDRPPLPTRIIWGGHLTRVVIARCAAVTQPSRQRVRNGVSALSNFQLGNGFLRGGAPVGKR